MRVILTLSILIGLSQASLCQSSRAFKLLKAGKFEEAIVYSQSKIEKSKNPVSHYRILARAYSLMGDDIQAEIQYKRALDYIDQKERKHLRLVDFDILDELSLLNVRTGNWEQARQLAHKSLQLRVKWWNKNSPTNFRPYLPLGMLHFAQGSVDSSKYYLNIYRKSLKNSNYTSHLDVDKYADVFQLLADISLQENDLDQAIRFSKRSLRLQSHEWTRKEVGKNYADRIRALNSLTSIYIQSKEYRKAKKTNQRAVYMLEKYAAGNELLKVDTYLHKSFLMYNYGEIEVSKGLVSRAMKLQVDFVKNTMTYLSEYEKENIYGQFKVNSDRILSQVHTLYTGEYIDSKDTFREDVLNYIINTKAIILSETNKIIEGAANSKQDSLSELLTNWKQLKQQWNYLTSASKRRGFANHGKASGKKANKINQRIISIEKELSARLKDKPIIDWKSIRKRLGDKEMAIEMVKVNQADSSTLFMIMTMTHDSTLPEIIYLDKGIPVKKYVESYFNTIKYDIADTLMYPVVWKPLNVPDDIKKVYISPSGIFHLVNFNTIRQPDGNFLADKHTIVSITNIANLAHARPEELDFTSALLIGVSNFSSHRSSSQYQITDLPGVAKEISQIDSLLKKDDVHTISILNEKATKNKVSEAESHSILHLATHGFFNTGNANGMLNSGVLLAGKGGMDANLLSAYEASLLNLEKTELVVLSACSSGLGKVLDGEGLYGLQRAFEAAGVHNIIMSMWDINDEYTQYFMRDFYSNLVRLDNVTTAFGEALRVARQRNSNPRLWGAFKLVVCN